MENDGFTPNTMPSTISDNTTDIDVMMDELLYDGYWLETTEGSDFWQSSLCTPTALNLSLYNTPTSETNMDHSNPSPYQKSHQDGAGRLGFGDTTPVVYPQMDELVGSQTQNLEVILAAASSGQSENFMVGSTETNSRLWIPPSAIPSPSFSVKKRLMMAIEHLRDCTRDRDVLIQIWVPINRGGKHFLTTNNQPFSLNPNCKSLADYRNVSSHYQFAAEENSKDFAGMPGRVFLKKLPEWTPDVRFFRSEEYPRINYAQRYNVSGCLALPVFERGSGTCLGVVEVVTTTQKANYRPELENVCKALEAVDLRSSEISSPPTVEACDDSYQDALAEIQEVLKYVCDSYGLPLAQTWAPCVQQGKAGCRHSNENYARCVSTIDSACYVPNPALLGFHEACSEHHLLRGEGVAGGAFMSNQPCFATDITAFRKTEYPLSHHARMFELRAAVAIRFRCIYTGSADFVLEFFLPSECQDTEEQKHMLSSLSSMIKQVCRNLRVVTDRELEAAAEVPETVIVAPSSGRIDEESTHKPVASLSNKPSQEDLSWISQMTEVQQKGKAVAASLGYQTEAAQEELEKTYIWDNDGVESHHGATYSEHEHIQQDSGLKGSCESGGDFSSAGRSLSAVRKIGGKRRKKTEKTISLPVLRQYFSGSLKDAANSIGVCPTTLKRICRQHGISRWPSRKIKKVGHSLNKLQRIIDTVKGVDGAIPLGSFYSNFPELSTPNLPGTSTSPVSPSKMNDQLKQFKTQCEGSLLSPLTISPKSTSSSHSHSSSSSLCSTEAKHPPVTVYALGGGDDTLAEEPGGVLERVRIDAEIHDLGQDKPKLLPSSHSRKHSSGLPSPEPLPLLPKHRSQVLLDGSSLRVKATFGEENIRFSIKQNWNFGDLQEEIFRRFNIDSNSKTGLKYLDDDSEWVLLTCDADLEECKDIYSLSSSRIIKISVHQDSGKKLGSLLDSSGPS